jgi:hypothetical protein
MELDWAWSSQTPDLVAPKLRSERQKADPVEFLQSR